MTQLSEPVTWDRTIWRGTDHSWQLRRVTGEGEPIVPSSARAQVREWYGKEIWLDATSDAVTGARISIDAVAGWVTVVIPESVTEDEAWDFREKGVWDLEVVVDGSRYRWVQGAVEVSQDVTRDE